MCLHISSSLSLSNHPWISQNENCILVNSSLPLIRACWHPLILPFWSPQHKYGFPSKHLTSFVTEYLLVLWGVSLPQGGSIYHYSILTGGSLYHGGQNTISHRQPTSHCLNQSWPNHCRHMVSLDHNVLNPYAFIDATNRYDLIHVNDTCTIAAGDLVSAGGNVANISFSIKLSIV